MRYAHGVLGDAIEATELHAYSETATTPCAVQSVTLPVALVFEDTAPRLVDLDADGRPEILVVQSHRDLGAQLAVYGIASDGRGLALLATTPYIGRRHRWLAIIGAADLDGDGHMEIAYIDRPHLARTLRIWRYDADTLTEVAAATGLTNHRIGEAHISSGIRDCGAGPDILTADTGWTRLIATRFDGQSLTARDLGPWSPESLATALSCH